MYPLYARLTFEKLRTKLAESYGPVALANAVTRTRVMFKYAFDADLIDKPVKYGQGFKKPSRADTPKEPAGKRGGGCSKLIPSVR